MRRLMEKTSSAARIAALLLADRRGTVTIFAVIAFALLIAFVGLIVDVGRVMNIHSQANSYADRVALAAAVELDGSGDALSRAVRAAVGDAQASALVDPGTRFTLSGDDAVGVAKLTFLSELGPDPTDPFTRSPVAGDIVVASWTPAGGFAYEAGFDASAAAHAANFVLVDTTVETEQYVLFPIARFLAPGMTTEASVAPQAVAGFTQSLCNFPPMSICNPYENPNPPYGGDFTPIIGQQIVMQTKGAGAAWAPGDFGFLQTPAGSGWPNCNNPPKINSSESNSAAILRCILGLVQPNTQCVSGRVNIRPGQAETANAGLNIMFDIYDPPMQSKKNDPAFAPARNVTSGAQAPNSGQCSLAKQTPTANDPLPRDPCLQAGTCSPNPRFGDGVSNADLTQYWLTNHGATLPGSLLGGTRYDVYRYEQDNNIVPETPICAPPGVDNPVRDRRVLVGAIINCLEHDIHGAADNVPAIAYGEFFITEPVGDPADPSVSNIYAEAIGVVKAASNNNVVRTYPVLHR